MRIVPVWGLGATVSFGGEIRVPWRVARLVHVRFAAVARRHAGFRDRPMAIDAETRLGRIDA
jgi:hypothetical protein